MINDFIFLAFLVGNDFLPHLPTLDISEGGLDGLFSIYKQELPLMGGYITQIDSLSDSETPRPWYSMARLRRICERMALLENEVFVQRIRDEKQFNSRKRRDKRQNARDWSKSGAQIDSDDLDSSEENELDSKSEVDDTIQKLQAVTLSGQSDEIPSSLPPFDPNANTQPDSQLDLTRADWQTFYYRSKFPEFFIKDISTLDDDTKRALSSVSSYFANLLPTDSWNGHTSCISALCVAFLQGFDWVLRYYFQGVASWRWFFPFRYAPLASSLAVWLPTTDCYQQTPLPPSPYLMEKIGTLGLEPVSEHNQTFSFLRSSVFLPDHSKHELSYFESFFAFDIGSPFSPLEQLLGVLPPLSARFLPPPYRTLMLDPQSPILHYYPRKFEVDMNGKKSSWEGIALIPFIDDVSLKQAVSRIRHSDLSQEDQRRNQFGTDWLFYYDETLKSTASNEVVNSPLSFFTSIRNPVSRMLSYIIPDISHRHVDPQLFKVFGDDNPLQKAWFKCRDNQDFRASSLGFLTLLPEFFTQAPADKPLRGNMELLAPHILKPSIQGRFIPRIPALHRYPAPGFPCLSSLASPAQVNPLEEPLRISMVSELKDAHVNVFGRDSSKESLVIHLKTKSSDAPPSPKVNPLFGSGVQFAPKPSTPFDWRQTAQCYTGSRVWIDWPYFKEGRVAEICDGHNLYSKIYSSGELEVQPLDEEGKSDFLRDCQAYASKWYSTKAVDLGRVECMANVHFCRGLRRMKDGSIKKDYEETVIPIPIQLITLRCPFVEEDSRFLESPAPTIESAFPIGSTVAYIGANLKAYGSIAEVLSYNAAKTMLNLRVRVLPPEKPFAKEIIEQTRMQFFPSAMIARQLNMHPLVLSKICSNVILMPGRVDVGLRLKFAPGAMQVEGYAKRVKAWDSQKKEIPEAKEAIARLTVELGNGKEEAHTGYHPGNHHNAPSTDDNVNGSNDAAYQWEYSERAVALIIAYRRRFPVLFETLEQDSRAYFYNAIEIAERPTKESALEAIRQIQSWLGDNRIESLVLTPCSSQIVDERGVHALEKEQENLFAVYNDTANQECIEMNDVPVYHCYVPNPRVSWSPTYLMQPQYHNNKQPLSRISLGDRVMSLRSDEGIPFGVRGTVVSIHGSNNSGVVQHVEVVCDVPLLAGSSLLGRCSAQRGQTVFGTSLLNLSQPNVLQLKDTTNSSSNNSNNNKSSSSSALSRNSSAPQQQQQQQQQQKNKAEKKDNNNNSNNQQQNAKPAAVKIAKRPQSSSSSSSPSVVVVASSSSPVVSSPPSLSSSSQQQQQQSHPHHHHHHKQQQQGETVSSPVVNLHALLQSALPSAVVHHPSHPSFSPSPSTAAANDVVLSSSSDEQQQDVSAAVVMDPVKRNFKKSKELKKN